MLMWKETKENDENLKLEWPVSFAISVSRVSHIGVRCAIHSSATLSVILYNLLSGTANLSSF